MAQDLGVKDTQVNFELFAMAALPFALLLDRIMNGLSRPMFGWISDHIRRENTMFIAFTLEGLGIVALALFGSNPWAFVLLSGAAGERHGGRGGPQGARQVSDGRQPDQVLRDQALRHVGR